jgi:TPR repeat protein
MRICAAVLLSLLGMGEQAHTGPARVNPELTWEWYNTAETYLRYKTKGKDDLRIAIHYFRLAAEAGNAAACYKVGEAYENGTGVTMDFAESLKWYRRAAEAGDKYAYIKVGYFYEKGMVVGRDPAAAVGWYRKAQAKGNIWAYHMLAFMLADGEGMPQDLDLARAYLERSLPETNDPWAKWKLAQLIRSSDPARAKALLQQAAAAGNAQAARELRQ